MKSRILHQGAAHGPVLVLTEALSFWGAFDPREGEIIDIHHPQRGAKLKGVILVMPETRGSGTAPGGIAEALRLGTGPAAIILGKGDMNLAIGAEVAQTLYATPCPVLEVDEKTYAVITSAKHITIAYDGTITVQALPNR